MTRHGQKDLIHEAIFLFFCDTKIRWRFKKSTSKFVYGMLFSSTYGMLFYTCKNHVCFVVALYMHGNIMVQ